MARRSPVPAAIVILIVIGVLALLRERDLSTPTEAQSARPHLYDIQYPAINYGAAPLRDPISRLEARIASGDASLEFDGAFDHGYLPALLRELGIDQESQTLVFSRTSAQVPYISAATPRALYFTDDVYVGWPPGAPDIEIATMDPNLGPVFYTLSQEEGSEVRFQRRLDECLRCHDSYSLTGGGVPRYILGSGFTDANGEQITHEGWILADDRTPLERRWGGWYVTGTHGQETHMGNWVIRDPEELRSMDLARTGNVTDLSTMFDTARYLTPHSDIVALMVMDHQTHVQNALTRVNYDTRTLLDGIGQPSTEALARVGTIAEPLVEALLMVDTPELTDRIEGTSGFAARFEANGPFDPSGRTLRELDLERRLFRYPCSYLIYSDAFSALPDLTKQYVARRLREILGGEDQSPTFGHLAAEDRLAALEILRATKPDLGL